MHLLKVVLFYSQDTGLLEIFVPTLSHCSPPQEQELTDAGNEGLLISLISTATTDPYVASLLLDRRWTRSP